MAEQEGTGPVEIFKVHLTDHGFVVYDVRNDKIIRGAFHARHKARECAANLNTVANEALDALNVR